MGAWVHGALPRRSRGSWKYIADTLGEVWAFRRQCLRWGPMMYVLVFCLSSAWRPLFFWRSGCGCAAVTSSTLSSLLYPQVSTYTSLSLCAACNTPGVGSFWIIHRVFWWTGYPSFAVWYNAYLRIVAFFDTIPTQHTTPLNAGQFQLVCPLFCPSVGMVTLMSARAGGKTWLVGQAHFGVGRT